MPSHTSITIEQASPDKAHQVKNVETLIFGNDHKRKRVRRAEIEVKGAAKVLETEKQAKLTPVGRVTRSSKKAVK